MSSVTPKPSTKKTKWVPNPRHATASVWFRPLALLLVCAGCALVLWVVSRPSQPQVLLGGNHYVLEVADTEAARTKGLSGRTSLPEGRAMLFVFDPPRLACFWMKDMRFSIDIVWLDAQKRVVKIEPDLAPSTYPQTFCSELRTNYVLEFPAGTAERNTIQLGQTLRF
jgi:uncharacterized membrane protein (UPF0127 family)